MASASESSRTFFLESWSENFSIPRIVTMLKLGEDGIRTPVGNAFPMVRNQSEDDESCIQAVNETNIACISEARTLPVCMKRLSLVGTVKVYWRFHANAMNCSACIRLLVRKMTRNPPLGSFFVLGHTTKANILSNPIHPCARESGADRANGNCPKFAFIKCLTTTR